MVNTWVSGALVTPSLVSTAFAQSLLIFPSDMIHAKKKVVVEQFTDILINRGLFKEKNENRILPYQYFCNMPSPH